MAPNKHECLWACYPYHRSFFLVNPDPLPERRRRERGFIQRYYETLFGILNPSILLVFFWKPLPSVDAVFTCLSWNLLSKSPFSKYGKCEYNILLLRFLLYHHIICSTCFVVQPLSTTAFLHRVFCLYFIFSICSDICGRLPLFGLSFNPSIYIPSSHHIYLFNHWQAQLLSTSMNLSDYVGCNLIMVYNIKNKQHILSFTFTSFFNSVNPFKRCFGKCQILYRGWYYNHPS